MSESLRVLVLGGTSWLGGAIASHAVSLGHEVVCLARGESGSVPIGATHVRSDRWAPGAYDSVAAADWDLVVDVSWQPEQVRSALAALAPRARRWAYVSSISAYADHATPGADESAPLLPAWSGSGAAAGEVYGEAKVSCETACREAVDPGSLLIARAGLIVGYGDLSDRFGYWPARFARAKDHERVLAPSPETPVQVIDVHDLAAWLVDAPARAVSGAYDAVGPQTSFAEVAEACASATGQSPDLVGVDDAGLEDVGVSPWAGPESLPLWLPPATHSGMVTRSGTAVRASGLQTRPLGRTVEESLSWERELGLDRGRRAGLTPAREAELLQRLDGVRG